MHPRIRFDILRLLFFVLALILAAGLGRGCMAQDGRVWHSAPPPLNMQLAGEQLRMASWKGGTAFLCVGFGYGAEALFVPYTSTDGPLALRYVGLGAAVYFGTRATLHGVRAGHHLAMEGPVELYELPGE